MNIRMVLLTSAAAMAAAASPVFAADAIVAAEPEAVEYVRVCDAYGTGYFYIPGTETCLKIGGYLRFEVYGGSNQKGNSDWNARTRAQVQFTAKSDTEYGPLTGVIVLRNNGDNASTTSTLDSAYIDIAGVRAGLFYSWWDDDLSGEPDSCPATRPSTTPFATSTNPATSTLAFRLTNWKTALARTAAPTTATPWA